MSVPQVSEKQSTKTNMDDKAAVIEDVSTETRSVPNGVHTLQRQLNNRQIQLIAIGGSIGTAIFVSIGGPLATAGPGNLLLGYTTYCTVLALASNGIAEMTTYMPVSGGFITLAGKWVDEALGFMAGWNFFLYEALIVPFEITALHLVLSYWSDHVPVIAVCLVTIFLYGSVSAMCFCKAEYNLTVISDASISAQSERMASPSFGSPQANSCSFSLSSASPSLPWLAAALDTMLMGSAAGRAQEHSQNTEAPGHWVVSKHTSPFSSTPHSRSLDQSISQWLPQKPSILAYTSRTPSRLSTCDSLYF